MTRLFLLSTLLIFTSACKSGNTQKDIKSDDFKAQDLELVLPDLLNKTVSEITAELNLKMDKIALTDEPPSIIRGFLYPWDEQTTIQFMTGRSASIFLKKELTQYEIHNSNKIDFDNLLEKRVIGITWETDDNVSYIGMGFVWPYPGYNHDPDYLNKIQRIKKNH